MSKSMNIRYFTISIVCLTALFLGGSNFMVQDAYADTPTWQNVVGVSIDNNDLTKITGFTGWNDSGASSVEFLPSGDGYVTTTVAETDTGRMIGLSNGDTDQNYDDGDFIIYLQANVKTLTIYEKGVKKDDAFNGEGSGTYNTGDILKVAVESGVVKYYQGVTEIYKSKVAPDYPLLVDTALHGKDATLKEIQIDGNWDGPLDLTPVLTTSNGSGCDDCEPPTLGIDSKSKRLVYNGFTYNGKSVDVERFFTPYPLITATVGQQNTAVFKIYEDKGPENIKHFSFAFGLADNEIISYSKAMIELDIDQEGTETVTITDPENALQVVMVSTDIGNCNDNDSMQCLIITIPHTFKAPLDFNIVATDVWDMKRNAWQNYFNHGIEVTGESLNPPAEYSGINKGHTYHLTETNSTSAIDEFGNSWSFTHDIWKKDYIKHERVSDTPWVAMNRMHSDFYKIQDYEIKRASEQLLVLCPDCLELSHADFKDSWSYELPERKDRIKSISDIMDAENKKALDILNEILYPPLSQSRYR